MAINVSHINTASDTFEVWVNKTNEIANLISNSIITANAFTNGALTTGNSFLNGIFSATELAVNTLRGGNVSTNGVLTITTNVVLSGTLSNIHTLALNSTSGTFGNLSFTKNILTIGNSTVNVVTNSTSIVISGDIVVTENNRILVANGGTNIATRKILNFVSNNNIDFHIVDDSANNRIDVSLDYTAQSAAGGTNTYIQFNDSTSFGGSDGFIFNKTTNTVSVSNTLNVANLYLTNTTLTVSLTATANASATLFDSFTKADWRSGEYLFSIKSATVNAYQVEKILILNYGGNAMFTSYGVLYSNGLIGTFSANANTTHIKLYFDPGASNVSISSQKTLIKV